MQQGTDEWFAARLGKVTASRCHEVIARTKSGYTAARKKYMDDLIEQRLTGKFPETYSSNEMSWGVTTEPFARERYESEMSVKVKEVGLVNHEWVEESCASPDGLVGSDGLIEIKCPKTTTMINYVTSETIPDNYQTQMLWQLACTQRKWCDFVVFDPRLPFDMQIWIKRFEPDVDEIGLLESEVRQFLFEVAEKLETFEKRMARNGRDT